MDRWDSQGSFGGNAENEPNIEGLGKRSYIYVWLYKSMNLFADLYIFLHFLLLTNFYL